MSDRGRVVSVNIVHELAPYAGRDGKRLSAIDKRPVTDRRVAVGELGLDGDRQVNLVHHGGPDKAVYAYSTEDLNYWETQLLRRLAPGLFGENLTVTWLDLPAAVIGEVWRVGEDGVQLEVTMPRTPCATFARRMGEPRWVRRFTDAARTGAYLRVRSAGTVGVGDEIEVVHRPDHGVTVAGLFSRAQLDRFGELRKWGEHGGHLAEPVSAVLASTGH